MSRTTDEFKNFDRTMHDLMNVSHDEIKKELEAEKIAKQNRPTRKRKADDSRDKDHDSSK
jgi:hypothetical protein